MNILNNYLVPNEKLKFMCGRNLIDLVKHKNEYYGAFSEFLQTRSMKKMAALLQSMPDVIESTIYRASIIDTMKIKGISYKDAQSVAPDYTNYSKGIDCAIETVLINYLEIADSRHINKIQCKIDLNGDYIVHDGCHRAIINYHNGFSFSECEIIERDSSWLYLHEIIQSDGLSLYKNIDLVYQKIFHSDFQQYKSIRDDRHHAIYSAVALRNLKSGIELGPQFAQNSIYLASNGIKMQCFEFEKKYYEVAKIFGRSHQNFKIDHTNIFSVDYDQFLHYDFILMSSLLYHLIRNNKEQAIEFLNNLKQRFDYMIIDSENLTTLLTDKYLLELMNGFSYEKIFEGADGRNIYFFSK